MDQERIDYIFSKRIKAKFSDFTQNYTIGFN